jgi:hypothetical protein
MRNLFTIRWLGVVPFALIAIVLTASTASAQEAPVEIWEEDGGHCEPCYVHGVGEWSLEVLGVPFNTCLDEFEAELWEDPEEPGGEQGHIYEYLTDAEVSPGCTHINCNGVGEPPTEEEWELHSFGELRAQEGHFRMDLCLDEAPQPDMSGTHCPNLEVHLEEASRDSHDYILSSDHLCPDGTQFVGQWEVEGDFVKEHDEIEIVHVD